MSTQDFVSRQLDETGCKLVGIKLAANVAELKKEGAVTFPPKLEAAVQSSHTITEKIASLTQDETPMKEIDTGADHGIGGFHGALEGVILSLEPVDFLPLSEEGEQRLAKATRAKKRCFPEGVTYLKADFDTQFSKMESLGRVLRDDDEVKGLLKELGFTEESNRILQWVTLYGDGQGRTKTKDDRSTQLRELIPQWHESYRKAIKQAEAAFDDETDPAQVKALQAFRSAYQEYVEKLRAQARAAAIKKAEEKKVEAGAKKTP